jgi:hypothetical protein
MTSKPESHERRRYPRLKDSCRIRYKRVEAGAGGRPPLEALTINISGGGIGFATDEAVEVGTLLAIELGLPGYETPVIALGRVTWCDAADGGRHEVGLEFWWIGWGDDGAQKAISAHIRKALERT